MHWHRDPRAPFERCTLMGLLGHGVPDSGFVRRMNFEASSKRHPHVLHPSHFLNVMMTIQTQTMKMTINLPQACVKICLALTDPDAYLRLKSPSRLMLNIYGTRIASDEELKCRAENILLTMVIDYYEIFNTFSLWLDQIVRSRCFLHHYTTI